MTLFTENNLAPVQSENFENLLTFLEENALDIDYGQRTRIDKGNIYQLIYEGKLVKLPESADPYHKLYLSYCKEIWKTSTLYIKNEHEDVSEDVLLDMKEEYSRRLMMTPKCKTQVICAMGRALLENTCYNYTEFHVEFNNGDNRQKITKSQLNTFFKMMPKTKVEKAKGFMETGMSADDFFPDILADAGYYPCVKWAQDLKWDGQDRFDYFLHQVLKVQNAFDELLMKTGMKSAMDRWECPGAKNDNVIVLQGFQGVRKSTAIKALAPEDKYLSTSKFENKDDLLRLNRKYLVEFSEIEQITTKKDSEAVKDFIQNQTDNFRVPYGEMDADYPRAYSVWGSANGQSFLKDQTGSRRFFIIRIPEGHKIDVEWIEKNRDQLWAQIKQDETILPYLSPEDEAYLQQRNKALYVEDDLLERVFQIITEADEDKMRQGILTYHRASKPIEYPLQASTLFRLASNIPQSDYVVRNQDSRKIGEWLVNNGFSNTNQNGTKINISFNGRRCGVYRLVGKGFN